MTPKVSKLKLPPLVTVPAKLARGFAVMRPTEVKRIASLGGQAISKNKRHMQAIGAIGGTNSHKQTNGK
jgi:hypothetical protein